MSSNFYVASLVVGLLTQFIQKKTGWNPATVGFVVSLCAAAIGVSVMKEPSWQDAIGDVFMRAIQLYLSVAGGVAAAHAMVRKYGRKPAVSEAAPKREFWKPWF